MRVLLVGAREIFRLYRVAPAPITVSAEPP